jgi:hypothetical protein
MADREILFCSCGIECLVLEKFTEKTVYTSNCISMEDELCISLFKYIPYAKPCSIWKRIRYSWYIMWSGQPYYDQVILDKVETRKLIRWLTKKFKFNEIVTN